MQAGRNTKNFNPYATVDWMAYQGAPSEGMAGAVKIQKWWSGTKCADVTFPKVGLRLVLIIKRAACFSFWLSSRLAFKLKKKD